MYKDFLFGQWVLKIYQEKSKCEDLRLVDKFYSNIVAIDLQINTGGCYEVCKRY